MSASSRDPRATTIAFRRSMVKPGESFMAWPVDRSLLTSVGSVVIYWGQFELCLDELLDMLIYDAWSEVVDGKLSSQFKARKKLMLCLVNRVFGDGGAIADYFKAICDRAEDLRWRRDIVAHGTWLAHYSPNPSDPVTYTATGRRHGKTVTLTITEDTLDQLWHDLGHLAGDLAGCSGVGEAKHSLSLNHRQALQAFVSKARPGLPKRRMPAARPSKP